MAVKKRFLLLGEKGERTYQIKYNGTNNSLEIIKPNGSKIYEPKVGSKILIELLDVIYLRGPSDSEKEDAKKELCTWLKENYIPT